MIIRCNDLIRISFVCTSNYLLAVLCDDLVWWQYFWIGFHWALCSAETTWDSAHACRRAWSQECLTGSVVLGSSQLPWCSRRLNKLPQRYLSSLKFFCGNHRHWANDSKRLNCTYFMTFRHSRVKCWASCQPLSTQAFMFGYQIWIIVGWSGAVLGSRSGILSLHALMNEWLINAHIYFIWVQDVRLFKICGNIE